MAQFAFGLITGILMCVVALLVRCCIWFEKHHPEDNYWHIMDAEKGRDKTG